MMVKVKRYNKDKRAFGISLTTIFVFMLIYNICTYYTADDFAYMYSWVDQTKRITNVFEIFPSMFAHETLKNGRIVAHFFVQLFLMMPKAAFNVVNSLIFTLLAYKIYRYCKDDQYDVFSLWIVFVVLWYYTPAFGQVYLWLDGSCNYLWAVTFCLYYLSPYVNILKGKKVESYHLAWKVAYVFVSVLMGAYSETASFATILVTVFTIFFSAFRRGKIPLWTFLSLVALCIGYVVMVFAPGTLAHKVADMGSIGSGLLTSVLKYKKYFLTPCAIFVVLLGFSLFFDMKKRTILMSIGCVIISLCTNCMHCIASYYPERSMLTSMIFLCIGVLMLLFSLKNTKGKILVAYSGLILALVNVWPFVYGSYDIFQTYAQCVERDKQVELLKAEGVMDIELPLVKYKTKYSSKWALSDLSTDTADTGPNKEMARYYGVNSIIGVE